MMMRYSVRTFSFLSAFLQVSIAQTNDVLFYPEDT